MTDRTGIENTGDLVLTYDRSVMASQARTPGKSTPVKPEADTIARTELRSQPPGEVERREMEDARDKSQKPVIPPHTEAQVSPSEYLDREEVAQLAYQFWLDRQGGEGSAEEDWYRAEEHLRQRGSGR